jgi:hypothetical protein
VHARTLGIRTHHVYSIFSPISVILLLNLSSFSCTTPHSDVEDVTETLDTAFSKNALSAEFGIELLPIAPWEAAAYCTSQASVSTFDYTILYYAFAYNMKC